LTTNIHIYNDAVLKGTIYCMATSNIFPHWKDI
jgi:hypothetical protein